MVQELNSKLVANRAGMVCFNLAGQVLIVSSITNSKIWVFPKGHIEKDDAAIQDAAVRECLEETNIIASSLWKIGTSSYEYFNEQVVVEWWAGCAVRQAEKDPSIKYFESDFRESQWVSVPEALELLKFEDLRIILKKAVCWI